MSDSDTLPPGPDDWDELTMRTKLERTRGEIQGITRSLRRHEQVDREIGGKVDQLLMWQHTHHDSVAKLPDIHDWVSESRGSLRVIQWLLAAAITAGLAGGGWFFVDYLQTRERAFHPQAVAAQAQER